MRPKPGVSTPLSDAEHSQSSANAGRKQQKQHTDDVSYVEFHLIEVMKSPVCSLVISRGRLHSGRPRGTGAPHVGLEAGDLRDGLVLVGEGA